MMGPIEKAVREAIGTNKEWELMICLKYTFLAIIVSLAGVGIGIHTYSTYGGVFGVFVLGSTAGVLIMFVIFALLIGIEIIRSKKGAKK